MYLDQQTFDSHNLIEGVGSVGAQVVDQITIGVLTVFGTL